MACRQVQLLAMVAAVACLASMASATVFIVGDGQGWSTAFNQTDWTKDKTFYVHDNLMFIYNKEMNHTVAQVGKDDFAACKMQGNALGGPWQSGYDFVELDKPGKVWFICTMPGHCDIGMKLAVDVQAVAPTAEPPSSAPLSYTVGGAVAVAGAVLAAVLAF